VNWTARAAGRTRSATATGPPPRRRRPAEGRGDPGLPRKYSPPRGSRRPPALLEAAVDATRLGAGGGVLAQGGPVRAAASPWHYMQMLAGIPGVKPDRMICRFVADALGTAPVALSTTGVRLGDPDRCGEGDGYVTDRPSTTPSGSGSAKGNSLSGLGCAGPDRGSCGKGPSSAANGALHRHLRGHARQSAASVSLG